VDDVAISERGNSRHTSKLLTSIPRRETRRLTLVSAAYLSFRLLFTMVLLKRSGGELPGFPCRLRLYSGIMLSFAALVCSKSPNHAEMHQYIQDSSPATADNWPPICRQRNSRLNT